MQMLQNARTRVGRDPRMNIELLFVVFLVVVGIGISFYQTAADIAATPKGTVFPLVHNYSEDYYYYLHLMRQGYDGAWKATTKLTPEEFAPQFVNPFFLILGKIARVFHTSLPVVYTASRLFGTVSILIVSYYFCRLTYLHDAKKRIASLTLIIFGGFWWGWSNGMPTVPALTRVWTELDPMVRLSFIPHHLWSKVFMLLSFFMLYVLIHPKRKKTSMFGLIGVAIFVVLMGITSPVALATFIPTMSMVLILSGIRALVVKHTFFPHHAIPVLMTIGIGLILIYYYRMLETSVFPWTSYKPWEDAVRFPVTAVTYAQSLGPTFILFFLSLPMLLENPTLGLLYLSWVSSPWIMIFLLGRFIPLSNIRFLEGYQFIPLAIGAADGAWKAATWSSTLCRSVTKHVSTEIFYGILIVAIMVHGIVGFRASMALHRSYMVNDLVNPSIYVPKGTWEGIQFLSGVLSPGSIVVAPYDVGGIVAAFSGGRVIAGHRLMTLDLEKKKAVLDGFYRQSNLESAKVLLSDPRIGYVVADRVSGDNTVIANLPLALVFSNTNLRIYQVVR